MPVSNCPEVQAGLLPAGAGASVKKPHHAPAECPGCEVTAASPVSSSDVRLERTSGQNADTVAMSLESGRSISWMSGSFTAFSMGSRVMVQRHRTWPLSIRVPSGPTIFQGEPSFHAHSMLTLNQNRRIGPGLVRASQVSWGVVRMKVT
jgi:hypothetical protein